MKTLVILSILLLAACSPNGLPTFADPVPVQEMDWQEKGLSLALSETEFSRFPAGLTVSLGNESGKIYEYGGYFAIEVLKNGKWYAMDHSDAIFYTDKSFRDTGKTLQPGTTAYQPLSIEALGETLPSGDYRVVKTFMPTTEPFHEISVAVPFSVE